jgi:hypothetical protein
MMIKRGFLDRVVGDELNHAAFVGRAAPFFQQDLDARPRGGFRPLAAAFRVKLLADFGP